METADIRCSRPYLFVGWNFRKIGSLFVFISFNLCAFRQKRYIKASYTPLTDIIYGAIIPCIGLYSFVFVSIFDSTRFTSYMWEYYLVALYLLEYAVYYHSRYYMV